MNKKLFLILPILGLLFTSCSSKGSSGSSQTSEESSSQSQESSSSSDSSPVEDNFVISIGGTSTSLRLNSSATLKENQLAQYDATVAVAHKDDVVDFLNNNLFITPDAEKDEGTRKNLIILSEGEYKVHNDATDFNVYLYAWNDGSYSYWSDGYIDDTPAPELGKYIYVSTDGENYLPFDLFENPGTEAEYILNIDLQTTQQFYFYLDGVILRYAQVLIPCQPLVTSVGEDGDIAVIEDGEYNFIVSVANGVYLEKVPGPVPAVVYQIQFDDGDLITLQPNEAFVPEVPEMDVDCVIEEYQATVTNLTKGMELKFYADGERVLNLIGAQTYGGNLLYNNGAGKMIVHNAVTESVVTVKIYAYGSISIFMTGYAEEYYGPAGAELVSWYIVGQGSLWRESSWDIDHAVRLYSNPSSASDKGCILNVPFEVGDLFKVTDGTTWYGYEKVDPTIAENNAGLNCFEEAPDGFSGYNFRCKTAGYYDVYVNGEGVFWIQLHA